MIVIKEDDYLEHFGILGMRWGHRKEKENPSSANTVPNKKLSYRDKAKLDYLKRGYSDSDAEALAARKAKIRTAALIAGGVTVAVGAALAARYMKMELQDLHIKPGQKTFHIDRLEAKPLEPGREFFVTANQFDRFAYRFRLPTLDGSQRIERSFVATKDIRIPNARKSQKLYEEFLSQGENRINIKQLFEKEGGLHKIDYDSFVRFGPYLKPNGSPDIDQEFLKKTETVWKNYQRFLVDKGFQGVLDQNDRKISGFNVEQPVILFDAANVLKEHSRENIGAYNPAKLAIPTIRELTSKEILIPAAIGGAIIGFSAHEKTQALEAYRKVYPNSNKTDRQILKEFKDQKVQAHVYRTMANMQ